MGTPEIAPVTAAAMAADLYLGMPAVDDPLWAGANDSARSTEWEGWVICYSEEPGEGEPERIEAVNADMEVARAYRINGKWGEWEE